LNEKQPKSILSVPPVLCDVAPTKPVLNVPKCPRCGAEMQEDRYGEMSCFSLNCAERQRAREKALEKKIVLKIQGVRRFLWAA
jgi:hypothetical protein